jgi:hypothetical protein
VGIYVEIFIRAPFDKVWTLTQQPNLHQRWDLRFSEIQYLPKTSADAPQQFLYTTRIGCGLSIRGTGESVGQRSLENGASTSALKFASNDWKSLIKTGSGYWRYIPVEGGLRFLTWYDYEVRFGLFGKVLDLLFRPLIGWATAWSFDALRLWAEQEQTGDASLTLSAVHAIARVSVAAVWFWHGLVPKLLFRQIDERQMLQNAGLATQLLPWVGVAEILFALFIVWRWRSRSTLLFSALLMILATLGVALKSPHYLTAAFNPVTLNGCMIALAIIGFLASAQLPTARTCLRSKPKETT